MQSEQGVLILLVNTEVDLGACIRETPCDVPGVAWHTKVADRTNMSHETLLEELMLAGHSVARTQKYLFDNESLSCSIDHTDLPFTVAGHIPKSSRRRISSHKLLNLWDDQVCEAPQSVKAFKGSMDSMITSFRTSLEAGVETTSPLLDQLAAGNVIVEVCQPPGEPECVRSMVTVLKRVAEEQDIEIYIVAARKASDAVKGSLRAADCRMTLATTSDSFAEAHIPDITSMTCLAKHLTSYLSRSDPKLLSVFTDQFTECDDDAKVVSEHVVFVAEPHQVSVIYFPLDNVGLGVEFQVAPTQSLGNSIRTCTAQMDYNIFETKSGTLVDNRDVHVTRTFLSGVEHMLGGEVVDLGKAELVSRRGEGVSVASELPDIVSSTSSVEVSSSAEDEVEGDTAMLQGKLRTMYKDLVSARQELDALKESSKAAEESKEKQLKLLHAELAEYKIKEREGGQQLSSCREDVQALTQFSSKATRDSLVAARARQMMQMAQDRLDRSSGDAMNTDGDGEKSGKLLVESSFETVGSGGNEIEEESTESVESPTDSKEVKASLETSKTSKTSKTPKTSKPSKTSRSKSNSLSIPLNMLRKRKSPVALKQAPSASEKVMEKTEADVSFAQRWAGRLTRLNPSAAASAVSNAAIAAKRIAQDKLYTTGEKEAKETKEEETKTIVNGERGQPRVRGTQSKPVLPRKEENRAPRLLKSAIMKKL